MGLISYIQIAEGIHRSDQHRSFVLCLSREGRFALFAASTNSWKYLRFGVSEIALDFEKESCRKIKSDGEERADLDSQLTLIPTFAPARTVLLHFYYLS